MPKSLVIDRYFASEKQAIEKLEAQSELNKKIKDSASELDKTALQQYKLLNEQDIKQLVVDDKWMSAIEKSVKSEMKRISQRLTQHLLTGKIRLL